MSNWIADQVGNAAGGLVYLFGGGSTEQARGNALDAQLTALNESEYAPGGRIYNRIEDQQGTPAANEAYQTTARNAQTGATGNVLDQLQEAGQEGANAGLDNFWNGIAKALGGILGIFPWWLWLAAGVAGFFYLGGGTWLKGRIAKA